MRRDTGGWPVSGLWAIGLFVGIEMFVYGMSQVMLGIGHRAPERVHAHREAA